MTSARVRSFARALALAVLFLVCGSVASAGPACAQDARQLFQLGQEAYRLGDYDQAVELWERAYAQDPRPGLKYNVSQAHERAGRLVEAMEALELYVREAPPDDPNRVEAQSRLQSMRGRLERTAVVVVTDVEGATVLIDGEDRARTPRRDPLQVTPGTHLVVLRREGHRDFELRVSVPAGAQVSVEPVFEPLGGGGGGGGGGGAGALVPWILIGSGLAVGAVGAVMGGLALVEADAATFRDDERADPARTYALVSDVMLPLGVAAAAGGLVWLLVESMGGEAASADRAGLQVSPSVGLGSVGIDARVRF
jgi:tetratricopeptide (TPR) repeat protein